MLKKILFCVLLFCLFTTPPVLANSIKIKHCVFEKSGWDYDVELFLSVKNWTMKSFTPNYGDKPAKAYVVWSSDSISDVIIECTGDLMSITVKKDGLEFSVIEVDL